MNYRYLLVMIPFADRNVALRRGGALSGPQGRAVRPPDAGRGPRHGAGGYSLLPCEVTVDSYWYDAPPTLFLTTHQVSTSGHSLADGSVAGALIRHLMPLATIVTPNLPEASALLGGVPIHR